MTRQISLIALLLATVLTLSAQEHVSEHILSGDSTHYSTSHSIADLDWIAGEWIGTGLGGDVEELWSRPKNGHMIGICRFDQEGQLVFSEHCSLSETPQGYIEYRVKHFSPDFKGWEQPADYVNFSLIKLEGQTAYFNGATLIREGDVLKIYVWFEENGKGEEVLFEYERVK